MNLLVVLAVFAAASAQRVRIAVVESDPELGAQLAAAVDAALGEGAAVLAPVEPHEPLALASHTCAAASWAHAALGGDAAAAARAGLLLLAMGPAPPARTAPPAPVSTLDMYPHPEVLADAVAALCRAKGWREAVVLHEGSARAVPLMARDPELWVRARRLPPAADEHALRNLLLVLKRSGARQVVVWCGAACSVRVLDAAQRVGLLAEPHAYLLPALDLHTQQLADYSHAGANITALGLFDPAAPAVRQALAAWREQYTRRLGPAADADVLDAIERAPPSALVLAYDAASVVATALEELALPEEEGGDCERGAASFHADTLLNYIRSREWGGAGGELPLRWASGVRTDLALVASELLPGGALRPAATWSRAELSWRPRPPAPPLPRDVMTNRTFTVLIALNKPYVMRQQSAARLAGNARYEGFCIELIERLAALLHFNYTFVEQPDGNYGSRNKTTGQWNGMIRRLMEDDGIDFAITDLTITAEREEAVDFTTPFMNLGISILFRKPQPPAPALLAFLLPFSNGVWLCVGLAYFGTSLVLYVVGRLCPAEWQNPFPCIEEPSALQNQFTLGNAFWFTLGAVLMQGSEVAPVGYGSRAVASAWWVFALVIVNSYTANLATLLGTKTSNELIRNVRELADNELGITYGAKADGSTYTFFEYSNDELYKRMYQRMKEQDNPRTNEEGIEKVVKENYAFLAESTTIEYTVERNCEVTMIGDLLDSKGYGIAMKKNSQYRHSLNLALLNLQERGVLRDMKRRWWNELHGGGACRAEDDVANEELSMRNFLGLFLVLVVGCALGVLVSCVDLAWHAARHPREPHASYTQRLLNELRFVFRLDLNEKPLRGPLIPERSITQSSEVRQSEELEELDGEDEGREERRDRSEELRAKSGSTRRTSARHSSMHTASVRLARHTTPTPR